VICACVISCVDDRHSGYEKFFLAYGTVERVSKQDLFIVLDDNDTTLQVSESAVSLDFFKEEMRLIVDYSILEEAAPGQSFHYRVRLNQAKEIPTVEIDSSGETLGRDPVTVENYWLARGFLTFKYRVRGTSFKHAVNLTLLPRASTGDEQNEDIAYLELHHDALNDPNKEALTEIVSFPLYKVFPDTVEPVKLRISYNDAEKEGDKTTVEITYYPRK
jgi:hypothetical protein